MLVLFPDAAHDIGHPILNLLLHALNALLLFTGQVEASVQCVGTASVYLDELLVLEELLFRDEAGASGEILLGSIVVAAEVVTMGHALAVVIPIPGHKLNTEFTVCSCQHCAVEVGQHSVVTSQSVQLERGRLLHLPHIFSSSADDPVGFVLCGFAFRGSDILTTVGDAADLTDFTQWLIVQPDAERAAQDLFGMEALAVEDKGSFCEVPFLFLCVHVESTPSYEIKKAPIS